MLPAKVNRRFRDRPLIVLLAVLCATLVFALVCTLQLSLINYDSERTHVIDLFTAIDSVEGIDGGVVLHGRITVTNKGACTLRLGEETIFSNVILSKVILSLHDCDSGCVYTTNLSANRSLRQTYSGIPPERVYVFLHEGETRTEEFSIDLKGPQRRIGSTYLIVCRLDSEVGPCESPPVVYRVFR